MSAPAAAGAPAAAPRLLFVILAHDRPDQVLELARTLTAAARDATALIHFDVRAPAADFARLAAGIPDPAAGGRIRLVEKRAAGRWGSFGLVEAPLNALAQAEAEGLEPDYVILLSGACLPCRPVASLERFLAENAGQEFIEAEDAAWVGNGWRDERWQYHFRFDHKTQHPAEWGFFQVQRLLGLKRRFPDGLTPRFGSQWWALTWDTCRAILTDIRRNPRRLAFFRSVWIPDEMVFQTYVHALVHPGEIAGTTLTHFQFTNRGKPIVYHDDHAGYVRTLERFFLRKVSPGAARLRGDLLALASAPDDGAAFAPLRARRRDYTLKVAAQTHYPVPGQVFFRDQRDDMEDSVLARAETPYVVLFGPPALTGVLAARLDDPRLIVLGEVFAPGKVDLGEGRRDLAGLGQGDAAIRDMHPALYLARLRARCAGVPVLRWSPLHAARLMQAVLRDPRALVVAALPWTGAPERDRRLLAWASLRGAGLARMAEDLPGVAPDRALQARIDGLGAGEGGWTDWLGGALFHPARDPAPDPVDPEAGRLARGAMVVLPWGLDGAEAGAARRRALFESSLAGCRFADRPWFAALGLTQAWERELQGSARRFFEPLGAEAAALLERIADPAAGPATGPAADPEHDAAAPPPRVAERAS